MSSNPFGLVNLPEPGTNLLENNFLLPSSHPLSFNNTGLANAQFRPLTGFLKKDSALPLQAIKIDKQLLPLPDLKGPPIADPRKVQAPARLGNKRSRSSFDSSMTAGTLRHLIEEQKLKKQRLARKAELARLSRRRKKERLQELEQQNARLMQEIAQLKAEREKDQATIQVQAQKIKDLCSSPSLDRVKSGNSDILLFGDRTESSDQNSDSDLSRPTTPQIVPSSPEISAHPKTPPNNKIAASIRGILDIIGRQLHGDAAHDQVDLALYRPLYINFFKWVFGQKDSFYDAKDGLWCSLFQDELNCSPTQLEQLRPHPSAADVARRNEALMDGLLKNLQKSVCDYNTIAQANLRQLESVLDEAQMQALLTWINRFGNVCIKIKL